MTTRRVRDLASAKKRDTMMPVTISSGFAAINPGLPLQIAGGVDNFACLFFVPSARNAAGSDGFMVRKKRHTFSRGYAETVQAIPQDDTAWIWRRIVFTKTMLNNFNQFIDDGVLITPAVYWDDPTVGYMRTLWDMNNAASPASLAARQRLFGQIFAGTFERDWINPFTAKLDNRLINVVHDRTFRLGNSNSTTGSIHTRKFWHPINKNLWYGGDETGKQQTSNPFSAEMPQSVGDVCIVDLIAGQGESTSTLHFSAEGTYYWHEGQGN